MASFYKRIVKGILARQFDLLDNDLEELSRKRGFVAQKTSGGAILSLLKKLHPVLSKGQRLIRLGPNGDGGYLIPDDLAEIEACFSPGVCAISGFEKDCANRGMQVFMADRSVEAPSESHKLFHFTQKHVGAVTNDNSMTLDDWVTASIPSNGSDLILQMDIEGGEYQSFIRMSDALLRRFRIIVVELHGLDQLWNQPFFEFASLAINKILQTHASVHIHPNNYHKAVKRGRLEIPPLLEITFQRRDRIVHPLYVTQFPNARDFDNTSAPQLILPECWHH
jgi:hypothetical protein